MWRITRIPAAEIDRERKSGLSREDRVRARAVPACAQRDARAPRPVVQRVGQRGDGIEPLRRSDGAVVGLAVVDDRDVLRLEEDGGQRAGEVPGWAIQRRTYARRQRGR